MPLCGLQLAFRIEIFMLCADAGSRDSIRLPRDKVNGDLLLLLQPQNPDKKLLLRRWWGVGEASKNCPLRFRFIGTVAEFAATNCA